MRSVSTRARLTIASIFLFTVVISTSYFQTIFHFNTYLALAICLLDTILSALFLFAGKKG
jgi:hypothetical protein